MNTVSLTASVSRSAGGLFYSVRQLHRSLVQIFKINVNVFALRDRFSEPDLPKWSPLPVRTFTTRGPNQFGFAPEMQQALLEMDVDLLHTHGIWMYPSVMSVRWSGRYRRPYVISPHGMLDSWALGHLRWKKLAALFLYERRHLQGAACLRALCDSEAESMRKLGLRNPICVIPNGVELPHNPRVSDAPAKFEGEVKEALFGKASRGKRVLLYLGRIHSKKNLAGLIRAWRQAQGSKNGGRAEWLLAIAGWDQGGHEAELKKLADEMCLSWSDRRTSDTLHEDHASCSLVFVGPQFDEAKAAIYAQSSALILPSFSEGLPMTILEAWAHKKPVLMTPECNLPEGFGAEAAIRIESDVEGIDRGLRVLFGSPPGLLEAWGKNGRKLVAQRFTWPKVAREMKGVYDWLLGGGPQPDCVRMN